MVASTKYYDLLGISPTASTSEIKTAYKKKAIKLHPDKPTGNKEAFQDLTEAYEILSDDQKRKTYDQFGEEGVKNVPHMDSSSVFEEFMRSFGGGGESIFNGATFGGTSMFGNIFGQREKRTPDLKYNLNVKLEDLYFGKNTKLKINRKVLCKTCEGTGSATKEKEKCSLCDGRGTNIQYNRNGSNIQVLQSPCGKCNQTGKIVTNPCSECKGASTVQKADILEIHIKPGMNTGDTLVYEGYAEERPDHKTGNLILTISQVQHPIFERKGDDLHMTKKISLKYALLGLTFKIDHIDPAKQTSLKVDGVINFGEVKKFESMGMNKNGSLYIKFEIELPKTLNTKQKELVNEIFF